MKDLYERILAQSYAEVKTAALQPKASHTTRRISPEMHSQSENRECLLELHAKLYLWGTYYPLALNVTSSRLEYYYVVNLFSRYGFPPCCRINLQRSVWFPCTAY